MDYGWTTDSEFKRTKCNCNTRSCTGFIEKVVINQFSEDFPNNVLEDIPLHSNGQDALFLNNDQPDESSNTGPQEEITNALLLLSDTLKNNESSSNSTTENTVNSTATTKTSIITFTNPTDKEHNIYAALLSLLFHTVHDVDSIHQENLFQMKTESKDFWDIIHATKSGEPISWKKAMDSPLLKKFNVFVSDKENHTRGIQFLSFIMNELFPQHRLELQFSCNGAYKMKLINFVECPMPASSNFLLSNSTLALKAFVKQLRTNEDNCDISFHGKYFVVTNNRHNMHKNRSFYGGNVWGSYALSLPDDVTSELRFATLCGFVVGTSNSATQYTYLRCMDCNNFPTWTLAYGTVHC